MGLETNKLTHLPAALIIVCIARLMSPRQVTGAFPPALRETLLDRECCIDRGRSCPESVFY